METAGVRPQTVVIIFPPAARTPIFWILETVTFLRLPPFLETIHRPNQ